MELIQHVAKEHHKEEELFNDENEELRTTEEIDAGSHLEQKRLRDIISKFKLTLFKEK